MKKKKIGIVTTFWSKNYGAALQAFALQSFLQQNGYDVVFVNYHERRVQKERERTKNKVINAIKEKRLVSLMGSFFKRIRMNSWRYKYRNKLIERDRQFDDFVKRFLNIGPHCESVEKIVENYNDVDCFVCGSDQIWNPLVYGFSKFHFLEFSGDKKKVSYAASVAKSPLSQQECNEIIERLKLFSAISVREDTTRIELNSYNPNLIIRTVLDPTFLLSKTKWGMFSKEKSDKKYILLYVLSYNQFDFSIKQWINTIAKKNNMKVISLPFCEDPFFEDRRWEKRFNVSPAGFMNLLINAELIITNSFHATALSIVNNKQFVVINAKQKHETQSRIDTILDYFGLSDRYFQNAHNRLSLIEYQQINEKISNRVKEDGDWLIKSLED